MQASVLEAIQKLQKGEVVGMPTETVYGLAACIDNPEAITKIFTTKERPFFDPLIVHVSSLEQARSLAKKWPPICDLLAKKYWPGPLTMVVEKSSSVSDLITSGLESVGIRMPQHPQALEMISGVGVPLAAPSANKFGKTSPTSAKHVMDEFGSENIAVVDGGDCLVGIESTVLSVKEVGSQYELAILRKGHVTQEDIESYLADKNMSYKFVDKVDKRESPGHMKHHYMPAVPLVMVKDAKLFGNSPKICEIVFSKINLLPEMIEEVKIVKPKVPFQHAQALELGEESSLAARIFYAKLRELSQNGADLIIFEYRSSVHARPEWAALMDRMHKAASLILD